MGLRIGPRGALYLILGIAEGHATEARQSAADYHDWVRVREICEALLGVESQTADEKLTGPESSREEVVGISTRGKSNNFSNTGFGGGNPERVAPAFISIYLAKLRLAV